MKKIIIVLVIILSAVMFLGIKYQKSSLYDPSKIEKVNKEMMSKFSSTNNEEVVQGVAQVESNEVIEDLPPQIEIIYPSAFNDGDTIESDMIHLKFSDVNKVIKATMNNQEISTEEIQITTEGIYIVEIQDDTNKITTLTFTLKHKPEEPKITTKTTPVKKTSTKAAKEQAAREKAAREQAAREKAAGEQAAREKAAREQAAREQAAREQAAKELAEKEQAAREQAEREQAQREQAEREQVEREQAEQQQVEQQQAQQQQVEQQQVEQQQVE